MISSGWSKYTLAVWNLNNFLKKFSHFSTIFKKFLPIFLIFQRKNAFSLRVCLAVCLIFQWFSAWRAYKLRAYKKNVYSVELGILSDGVTRDMRGEWGQSSTGIRDADEGNRGGQCKKLMLEWHFYLCPTWLFLFTLHVLSRPVLVALLEALSVSQDGNISVITWAEVRCGKEKKTIAIWLFWERQIDRQTNRQTDRQTNRQRYTDRKTNKWKNQQ